MTTWRPDTCGCEITLNLPSPDFDWANITADHIASVAACEYHSGAPIDVFNQVYHGENKIKNMLLGYVQENQSSLQPTQQQPALSVSPATVVTSNPAPCPYCSAYDVPGMLTFDQSRVVNYQASGLDAVSLQAWADQTFGAGKVVVG